MRPGFWIASYGVVVALFTLAHMSAEPYDDGHFKRIALHGLDRGALAWNVDEGPVYGSTSQLFQWLAMPVTALAGEYYMSATRAVAALCLVAAFAALLRLSTQLDRGVAAVATFSAPTALYPVLSGMETTLVFALLAMWLLAVYGEAAERRSWVLAPGLVVFIYLARPDALLLVVPPLLVVLLAAQELPRAQPRDRAGHLPDGLRASRGGLELTALRARRPLPTLPRVRARAARSLRGPLTGLRSVQPREPSSGTAASAAAPDGRSPKALLRLGC